MPDPHSNFGYSTVATAPSPASSGTSLVVQAADGAKFPSTGAFNATVWPASTQPTSANAEIVRVTAISTDTFTITRAQESTSARTIVVGDQIAATVTVKTLTDVELARSYLTSVDQLVPANTQASYEDYLELASSFVYELASGAELIIGDYATPIIGPGYELNYTEITSTVNIVSTTEATPTTIISLSPIMFDGLPVVVHFYGILQTSSTAGASARIMLFEGTTEITRLVATNTQAQLVVPVAASYRFTPSAGLHTYTITAMTTSATGTPGVAASAVGTASGPPAFVRFTKV